MDHRSRDLPAERSRDARYTLGASPIRSIQKANIRVSRNMQRARVVPLVSLRSTPSAGLPLSTHGYHLVLHHRPPLAMYVVRCALAVSSSRDPRVRRRSCSTHCSCCFVARRAPPQALDEALAFEPSPDMEAPPADADPEPAGARVWPACSAHLGCDASKAWACVRAVATAAPPWPLMAGPGADSAPSVLETDVGPDGLMEPCALAPPPVQVQPMTIPPSADVGARGTAAAAIVRSFGGPRIVGRGFPFLRLVPS